MGAVSTRISPRRLPPLALAHGGAATVEPPDTRAAVALGHRLGATGLESGLWLTADDVPVVSGPGSRRRGIRKRPIADLTRDDLGDEAVTVSAALELSGPDGVVVLRVGDAAAVEPACSADPDNRVWLVADDIDTLGEWRATWPDRVLVHAARLQRLPSGPERLAATIAAAGINAVQFPHEDWTGGLVTLFHRFDIECLAWNAPHDRMLDDLLRMGCDAISSPNVERLVDAFTRAGYR